MGKFNACAISAICVILLCVCHINEGGWTAQCWKKHNSGSIQTPVGEFKRPFGILCTYQCLLWFPPVCLDILPDECEQGDEEELMYKPFPDCCPVYCNLKRRMQRLKTMHFRHRLLLNKQLQQTQTGSGSTNILSEYGLGNDY